MSSDEREHLNDEDEENGESEPDSEFASLDVVDEESQIERFRLKGEDEIAEEAPIDNRVLPADILLLDELVSQAKRAGDQLRGKLRGSILIRLKEGGAY